MDGLWPFGEDDQTGEGCPEWCQERTQALAPIIRRCLQQMVGGSEPPGEVWERILARLRGPGLLRQGAPSGPHSGPY